MDGTNEREMNATPKGPKENGNGKPKTPEVLRRERFKTGKPKGGGEAKGACWVIPEKQLGQVVKK